MSTAPATAPSQTWYAKSLLILLGFGWVAMVFLSVTKVSGVEAPSSLPGFSNPGPSQNNGSGGNGSSNPGASASPTPEAYLGQQFITMALAKGGDLQDLGYEPVEVLELSPEGSIPGSNGQLSLALNNMNGNAGDTAYVVFRSRDNVKLVMKPEAGTKPDRVMQVNSGKSSDGNVVGYFQQFADNRGSLCLASEKVDISDPTLWFEINKKLRGKSLGGDSTILTNADLGDLVPAGEEVNCFTFRPDEELIPRNN